MTDAPLPPLPPVPPQPPYGAPQPPTSGKAIAALVLGIVGLVMCGCFPVSIVAWVLGKQAEREIRESGGTLGGNDLAKAGWITGAIGTVLSALVVIAYVGFMVAMFALGWSEDSSGY
jgi:hypothetical protein